MRASAACCCKTAQGNSGLYRFSGFELLIVMCDVYSIIVSIISCYYYRLNLRSLCLRNAVMLLKADLELFREDYLDRAGQGEGGAAADP